MQIAHASDRPRKPKKASVGTARPSVPSGKNGPSGPSGPPTRADVPDGTSAEVLDWVGEDMQRAQIALNKERANDEPREALVTKLQKILSPE